MTTEPVLDDSKERAPFEIPNADLYAIENALLADAARSYCRAMHANKDAEPVDWERARAEVDRTYFQMMRLAGYYEEPTDGQD